MLMMHILAAWLLQVCTSNVLKFRTSKKKEHPQFLSSPFKQREVTNFAKGGNLIASLCKIAFPHRMFGIFLFEIKILLFEFLEHLPYMKSVKLIIITKLMLIPNLVARINRSSFFEKILLVTAFWHDLTNKVTF